jgi:hypothetical protein
MLQYPAWSTWAPPPPPPAPPPPHHCTIQTRNQRCYNDTAVGSLLPVPEPSTHDKTTLEVCAWACFGGKHTLAGIDAGNHCWCGEESDLGSAAAKASQRPLSECEVTPCHADKEHKCGAVDRLLVYEFACTQDKTVPALSTHMHSSPTSYGEPNGPTWLPAETDFTLQKQDAWFYSAQAGVHTPAELRLMCLI